MLSITDYLLSGLLYKVIVQLRGLYVKLTIQITPEMTPQPFSISSVTNSKYHHQTKQCKGLNITTTAGTHRVKPRVASGFYQLEKMCNFLLPFSIGTRPPTGLIPLALKALFSKISCDLKAAWGRTCVHCEHVCMCKSGFLALGGITCVRFLSLSQIRLTVASGLCALCSHCCRPVPFTGIVIIW